MEAPSSFASFPYASPYAIQLDLMRELYTAIETRSVAVLESPTGTGKSLSVLCSSLQWLEDNAVRVAAAEDARANSGGRSSSSGGGDAGKDDDEPDWLREYVPAPHRDEQVVLPRPPPRGPPPASLLQQHGPGQMFKRVKTTTDDGGDQGEAGDRLVAEDDAFLLDEPVDDDDEAAVAAEDASGNEQVPHVQKIYYCSRTHSQLSQFLRELRRTSLADKVTVTSLGSRKNLCINDKVAKPSASATQINESCLELQRKHKSKAKTKGCAYLDPRPVPGLKYALSASVLDIEETAALGRAHRSCPYYASRSTVPNAQLVLLPYQMLLHASTRESLGIKLQEQIVIIDEAHNLIDTVADVHSASLTARQATTAGLHLKAYIDRYKTRLLSDNLIQLRLLEKLLRALSSLLSRDVSNESVLTLPQFWSSFHGTSTGTLDGINLFEMCRFIRRSQLSRKLRGFVDYSQNNAQTDAMAVDRNPTGASSTATDLEPMPAASAMHAVEGFLHALTNANQDGRILLQSGLCKYLLLNPARAFADVVAQARAVILLGGTMKPLAEFRHLLFPEIDDKRFRSFECGHIVPASSVLALTLPTGPTGRGIQLTLDSRSDHAIMDEIGAALVAVAKHVPDGLVCFFQKYDYADALAERWRATGCWEHLSAVKQIFVEPRTAAAVEGTLSAYSRCIENGTGAMLLCVVNGKMSEGINFKDRMGRGVVVVGLPYANRQSAALKAKIDYLNAQSPRRGDDYYENLCWKAVNQSIGRAIRHKDDYAAIILLDRRFVDRTARLPGWITRSVHHPSSFAAGMHAIDEFFVRDHS